MDQQLILTDSNYYSKEANWEYLSVSQFKDFMKCEAAALAKLKGEWDEGISSKALLVGNYVHSYFESKAAHENFLEENNNQLFKEPTVKQLQTGLDNLGTEYKKSAKKAELVDAYEGHPLPKGAMLSDFKIAEQMIDRIKDEPFLNFLWQGEPEKIVTGELFGVNWKGKIDLLNVDKGYFVDLKTTQTFDKRFWSNKYEGYVSFVEAYGYITQMAVYEQLLEQEHGKPFKGYIYAVTKEKESDIAAIEPNELKVEFELDYVAENAERVEQVKTGQVEPEHCGICDYCKHHKTLNSFVSTDELLEQYR